MRPSNNKIVSYYVLVSKASHYMNGVPPLYNVSLRMIVGLHVKGSKQSLNELKPISAIMVIVYFITFNTFDIYLYIYAKGRFDIITLTRIVMGVSSNGIDVIISPSYGCYWKVF